MQHSPEHEQRVVAAPPPAVPQIYPGGVLDVMGKVSRGDGLVMMQLLIV